jgi:hypothetical protein
MRPLGPFDGFAAAVRARQGQRAAAVPALKAAVLLVPRARDAAWHLHVAETRVNVAPRIALTVVAAPAAERTPGPAPVAATAPVVLARLRHSTSTARVTEALTLVRHASTRGVRVEPGASPAAAPIPSVQPLAQAPAAAATMPAPAAPPPPPLVVARPVLSAPGLPALAAMEPARDGRRNGAAPAVPGTTPTIDVERITDSVLGALDRRLIAHRERYGSI